MYDDFIAGWHWRQPLDGELPHEGVAAHVLMLALIHLDVHRILRIKDGLVHFAVDRR